MTARAEVVGVEPSRESVPWVIAVLRFRNDGPAPVRVGRYRVVWETGAITASPGDLVLRAGEERVWRLRIDPGHGRLDALTDAPAAARVEVLEVGTAK